MESMILTCGGTDAMLYGCATHAWKAAGNTGIRKNRLKDTHQNVDFIFDNIRCKRTTMYQKHHFLYLVTIYANAPVAKYRQVILLRATNWLYERYRTIDTIQTSDTIRYPNRHKFV